MTKDGRKKKIAAEEVNCDPHAQLAMCIVVRAVEDWRLLVKKKAWDIVDPRTNTTLGELRRFFKSDWCDFLMQQFPTTPEQLLAILEAELQEALKRDKGKEIPQNGMRLCRCGGEAEFVRIEKKRYRGFMRCKKCGRKERIYASKQNAVIAWNREM